MEGIVAAVSCSPTHSFTKANAGSIRLIAGLGVAGDAHHGATVKHRSRLAKFAATPNLRQVHLIHAELFCELRAAGFAGAGLTPTPSHGDAHRQRADAVDEV